MRIADKPGNSVNIDISARFDVPQINVLLPRAIREADEFVVVRVPRRSRNIIEALADKRLPSLDTDEHARLAQSGALATTRAWDTGGFSD